MDLIEREGFLTLLQEKFEKAANGEGHCIFISGEAGIGKTSLVKVFCKEKEKDFKIYYGTCDALFTPRPLAPLYDIALQMQGDFSPKDWDIADRAGLFTNFFHALAKSKETAVIVFEDVHWADEATLDFIKFLARRITQLPCFFILTYRDNEIHSSHPLRNVLGQLNASAFTRMPLAPLSKEAVKKLAEEKGYNADDVYSITGGNPFYVTEVLASYSLGVPDNIKDSILSVYNRLSEETRNLWDIMSVVPGGFKMKYLEKVEPSYFSAIAACINLKIVVMQDDKLFFKHELYRRTVETSLSPLARVAFHKKILNILKEDFEENQEIERIVHHAKNGNEYDLVLQYAPQAAVRAACVGSHTEASKLYLSVIEYYQGNDKEALIPFYESYAYECYLTNQIRQAIIYTGKALTLWEQKNDIEKIGKAMSFLSRLWWFDGNGKKAEAYAVKAIDMLDKLPSSSAKAMAYSNMSQLMMLADNAKECIFWGEKAIAMANELDDKMILCHALNNVGDVQTRIESSKQKGIDLLQQSLSIALKNSYHEHAARAYTNLSHNAVIIKDYDFARKILEEGIQYCENRELGSWTSYMRSTKARLELETGFWDEAYRIADELIKNDMHSPVVKISAFTVLATIKMRRGEADALPLLIEAKAIAFKTKELQRIIPAMVALLEYEWITAQQIIEKESIDSSVEMIGKMGNIYENSSFAFWLLKARNQRVPLKEMYKGYETGNKTKALKAASIWEKTGCAYEQALALFESDDDDKRKAIAMIQNMGASSVYEKLKMEMRASGIKSIPRGLRKTTKSNVAMLTSREVDVLHLLKEGLQNKEIAAKLFISAKTVDHHISSLLFKLEANSRTKAVQEAIKLEIIK